jgi:hypothetical protein
MCTSAVLLLTCTVFALLCAPRVSIHQLPHAAARRPHFSPAFACIASPKAKSRFTAGARAAACVGVPLVSERLNATHTSQASSKTAVPCCRAPSLPPLSLSLTPALTARFHCLRPQCVSCSRNQLNPGACGRCHCICFSRWRNASEKCS